MKKWIEIASAILGCVAAILTIISCIFALNSSGAEIETKSSIVRAVYNYGTAINETIGLKPKPKEAAPTPASAPVPPASPAPTPVPPEEITQKTPFAAGAIYVSGFEAVRRENSVYFSFSIRNTSAGKIFLAVDHETDLTAATSAGNTSSYDIKGIKRTYRSSTQPDSYTEISPNSDIFISASFNARELVGSTARFNINLIQLNGDKVERITFGRPATISEAK